MSLLKNPGGDVLRKFKGGERGLAVILDGRMFSFFGRKYGRMSNHFSFSGLHTTENEQFSVAGAAEKLLMSS